MNLDEIKKKLTELAFQKTSPFCYCCYRECPEGTCKQCGSDDLMRLLEEYGVEYGLCRVRHNPYYAENQIMMNAQLYT